MHQLYAILQLGPLICYTIRTCSKFNKKSVIFILHLVHSWLTVFYLCKPDNITVHNLFSLMSQKYQEHITASTGEDESALVSVVSLLEHTSELVSLFNDRMYIKSTNDSRLQKLNNFYSWMSHWEENTGGNNKEFISSKLWFDIQSMCLGFQSLVHYKLCKFPGSVVKPSIVNQDCVENHFCHIRSCNGQNDNPTLILTATVFTKFN